jgi:hypothetical protein
MLAHERWLTAGLLAKSSSLQSPSHSVALLSMDAARMKRPSRRTPRSRPDRCGRSYGLAAAIPQPRGAVFGGSQDEKAVTGDGRGPT